MNRTRTLLPVLLLFSIAITAQAAMQFDVTLSGASEVPGNSSTFSGFGTLDLSGTSLTYSIKVFNPMPQPLDGTFNGPAGPGSTAPVTVDLGAPSSDPQGWIWTSGVVFLSPSEASDLTAGDWYMNVLSSAFPSGELRGQIEPVPEPTTGILFVGGLGVLVWNHFRRLRKRIPSDFVR